MSPARSGAATKSTAAARSGLHRLYIWDKYPKQADFRERKEGRQTGKVNPMGLRGSAVRDEQPEWGVARRISRFALQQRSRIDQPVSNEGTRRLMWAVLKDTLRCYHTYADSKTVHGQRLFHDAERWLQSRDLQWVFSFENVCAALGVDSDYLRNELRRWYRNRSKWARTGS